MISMPHAHFFVVVAAAAFTVAAAQEFKDAFRAKGDRERPAEREGKQPAIPPARARRTRW